MAGKPKRIPYGIADYRRLIQDNMYYVDKTAHIPMIEAAPYYLLFIRPRRFGKTLWLSTLEYYYDINQAEHFDALFGDTYIGQHPTEEHNTYLILAFNFAMVNPDPRKVRHSFASYGKDVIENFLMRYQRFFDNATKQHILEAEDAVAQMRRLFAHVNQQGLKLYLLIDEYDNFANTILSTAGQQAYQDLTHGSGFFRFFFNILKGATTGVMGGLTRLFITGVSPVTMDDVTSGFNIGTNISLDASFNALLGFREDEVRQVLRYYHAAGMLSLDEDECLATMRSWYDGYRFSDDAQTSLYNADMVFYFLLQAINRRKMPAQLIDNNIRIDYKKLRHLILVNQRLNGNFGVLQHLAEEGEIVSTVTHSFPLEMLLHRDNFISLLFYFGLLTFHGSRQGSPVLSIPNLTVKSLLYGYIRDAFYDINAFRLDVFAFTQLMRQMAYQGDWQPLFDFLAEQVRQQTSIRDYLRGEKMLQGFLLAYLNVTNYYLTWSERELGGGFADIYLEPFIQRYRDMRYGYLIELKYLKRGEYSESRLQGLVAEAEAQLQKYASDARLTKLQGKVALKLLVLVYHGWELIYRAEVQR